MKDQNKRLFTRSNGHEISILVEFDYEGDKYCVYNHKDGWSDLTIGRISNFITEEETLKYQLSKEIERLKKEQDIEVKKIQDKAIKQLESRIRMNVMFSNDGNMAAVGIQVANELKKILENK